MKSHVTGRSKTSAHSRRTIAILQKRSNDYSRQYYTNYLSRTDELLREAGMPTVGEIFLERVRGKLLLHLYRLARPKLIQICRAIEQMPEPARTEFKKMIRGRLRECYRRRRELRRIEIAIWKLGHGEDVSPMHMPDDV